MRPEKDEYAPFYGNYIALVKKEDALAALEHSLEEALLFFRNIPQEKANFRYQEKKWTVKELLQHVVDTERIMAYRALRFARNDKTELSGYDEDAYVNALDLEHRSLSEIIAEYVSQRNATISLFRSFTPDALLRQGRANGQPVSVRALGFIIAGHEKHHLNVLTERYL